MAERSILFCGPMVLKTLDGSKTQTRRVINRLQGFGSITEFQRTQSRGYDWIFRNKRKLWNDITNQRLFECSPYGRPCDRLWVRETWCKYQGDSIHYAADEMAKPDYNQKDWEWKPSIHMPRWASRITLEITNVRVERVQEISNKDIQNEGTENLHPLGGLRGQLWQLEFKHLWDSINAKRGYGWDVNPHVWVIDFKRV